MSYCTTDVETARDYAARTFAHHAISVAGGVRDLDFHLDPRPSSRVTLGRVSYGADVQLVAPPMRRCYHVNLPLSGQSVAEQNGIRRTSLAGQAGVAFLPDGPLAVRWSHDAEQYAIKFPKELLDGHAARLAGRPVDAGIRFDLTFDLTTGPARAVVDTVGFMYAELSRPGGLATMPAACHEMEAALMTQLLMAVPNQLTPGLWSDPERTRPSKVREVLEFIDENPGAEVSTVDLAAMAGVSARALQAAFHDVVGMSPTAYLRGTRLDRVHRDLASGKAGTVTDAAARWGFFHLGRFARQYRERFGVLPSQTASRARQQLTA